jgi:mediator of RNA polymerase II transcription subunit 13
MDALKGCTSNVYVLKDIDTTQYRLYVCQEPASSCARRVSSTIAYLRGEVVMCSAYKDRIWVFDDDDKEEDAAEQHINGFRMESQGILAEHTQQSSVDERPIISMFLEALEGSITFALSRAHNAIKLSAWTWFLPEVETQEFGVEAHMQIQLSDDGKRLNVATVVRTSDLVSFASMDSPGLSEVVIGPSGMSATLSIETDGSGAGEKLENLTFALGDDQWKASVSEALAAEGTMLSRDTSWLSVVPLGSQKSVYWPTSLCFMQRRSYTYDTLDGGHVDDWRSWFDLPDVVAYDDPLSFAEEWTTTFAEREMQPYAHEAMRHEDSAMNEVSSVPAQTDNAAFDVTSPPLTNRPDLQALHGIYPTPPDGLVAHGVPQLQPQPESLPAANGESGHAPTSTPSDPTLENNVNMFDGAPDIEGDQLQRNHSIVSSIGANAQDWNRGSTDDLFGDMDDMEYGREEVGDADFNFFDEPDDEPVTEPVKHNIEARNETAPDTVVEHVTARLEPQQDAMLHNSTEASDAQPLTESASTKDLLQLQDDDHISPHSTGEIHADLHAAFVPKEEQSSTGLYNVKAQESSDFKPLSPFGIKEALLPPPIPASASLSHTSMAADRRRSSFGPLVFNTGNTFAPRSSIGDYSDFRPDGRRSSYDLGPTRVPLTAISESSASIDTPNSLDDAQSELGTEIDSEDDASSTNSNFKQIAKSKSEEPASFVTRKRKRTLDTSSYCGPQSTVIQQGNQIQHSGSHNSSNGDSGNSMQDLISKLVGVGSASGAKLQNHDLALSTHDSNRRTLEVVQLQPRSMARPDQPVPNPADTMTDANIASVIHTFPSLKSSDLVVLGQIVAEQAVAVVREMAHETTASGCGITDNTNEQYRTFRNLDDTLESIVSELILCDVSSLALVREPLQVQRPQASQPNTSMASQARQPPPRPPTRVDPTALGPDILPLTASFIRANRSESSWEMAPTALNFWEALGLSPASGPKDIRHFCIAPDNPALEHPVADYMRNLKAAYEGCKFGSMSIGIDNGDNSPREDVDYLHTVSFDGSTVPSLPTAMQAYWDVCSSLGSELAEIAFDEPCRTLVVSMINPFPSTTDSEWATASQHFGACFLNLSKSYHTAASRDKRFKGKGLSQRQISDIDFKILPIDLVASSSSLVVPSARQMGLLARELYDRCPPSSDLANESSPLSNVVAPSVELVAPLPKRISFQLTADPPADLLHEASVLHVAYATSTDSKWANVIWHDNTGRYVNSSALCMQGRSFSDIALEVWKRTVDLIKAREVIWRIFIVTAGGDGVETSRANCWKDIISQHTERKQLLSVTLLHFQPDLALNITPPTDSQIAQAPGSGAPTPAATPQPGSGQASTTSPDAVGAGNAPVTAPPTPAPSEAASSILEADPDAHLIETEDETWGMLIDRDVAPTLRPLRNRLSPVEQKPNLLPALSHGVLIKRGKTSNTASRFSSDRPYPCVGASLLWTLRVRPKGDRQGVGERPNVDEGSARHAEVMLREVLGMYRNLGLLSKVKGLDPSGLVPVHVVAAMKGAQGLNGLLREHTNINLDVD